MAADGASAAVAGIGIKAGIGAGAIAALVSLLATVVGFTIIPLTPGKELADAARRLAAGLFSSFLLGPLVAIKVIEWWPGYYATIVKLVGEQTDQVLWVYLTAAVPFIALSGIVGFWLVAALMRYFTKRSEKDALDMVREVVSRDPWLPPKE